MVKMPFKELIKLINMKFFITRYLRNEKKQLRKMFKSECKKVSSLTSNLKKITFNEILISCSYLFIVAIGVWIGVVGSVLSIGSLFSAAWLTTNVGAFQAILILILSILTLIGCWRIALIIWLKIKVQVQDHKNVLNYGKLIEKQYSVLNGLIRKDIQENTRERPTLSNESIFRISQSHEAAINEMTHSLLRSIKNTNTKKYMRFYLYEKSYVSNQYTQVLYISSSTLTIYSHFLKNSKKINLKDLLDFSFKMFA